MLVCHVRERILKQLLVVLLAAQSENNFYYYYFFNISLFKQKLHHISRFKASEKNNLTRSFKLSFLLSY